MLLTWSANYQGDDDMHTANNSYMIINFRYAVYDARSISGGIHSADAMKLLSSNTMMRLEYINIYIYIILLIYIPAILHLLHPSIEFL